MKINIYTKNNGVGLQADAIILKKALEKHEVKIIDWERPTFTYADLGIHLEHIRKEMIHLCPKNVAMPNPEWLDHSHTPSIGKMDAIFCKTHYTKKVMSAMHENCIYTNFTSFDLLDRDAKKRNAFLHLAGKSSLKNSEIVRDAWNGFYDMPFLLFQKLERLNGYTLRQDNFKLIAKRLPYDDIKQLMNMCMFHVCPSKAEGFGHYINEALSTGAIVITTDAEPMNELIKSDYGILLPSKICGKQNFSNFACVNKIDLQNAVKKLISMDDKTLMGMSLKARDSYIKRNKEFIKLINKAVDNL